MDLLNLFKNAEAIESVPAGATIFTEGSAAEDMYIVMDGEVNILRGKEVIDTVRNGGIFGEMALNDSEPRSATAVAATHCKLLVISEMQFLRTVQEAPYFSLQVMKVIARRLRNMNRLV